MASAAFPEREALEIAIDHRIRRLFKPVPHSGDFSPRGSHVDIIRDFGYNLWRDSYEVQVTTKLAGPTSTGGVAIVLQQPRRNHRFEKGIFDVINDSPTLLALKKSFAAASCNSLCIVNNVAVVDLLPYIPDEYREPERVRDAFQISVEFLVHKRPSVVFCAGRMRNDIDIDILKGESRKVESIGIGNTFPYPSATLGAENHQAAEIQRVNGFHPSFAMNRCPEYSCLRQLLLLEAAHTCAVHRGDWAEEPWMEDLRDLCKKASRERVHGEKSMPVYDALYSERLELICNAIESFDASSLGTSGGLYHTLVESRLSQNCNDASLILQRLTELLPDANRFSLTDIALNTYQLILYAQENDGWRQNGKLESIISTGLKSLDNCIWAVSRVDLRLRFAEASGVFHGMAIALEDLLWDLSQERINEQLHTEKGGSMRNPFIIPDD